MNLKIFIFGLFEKILFLWFDRKISIGLTIEWHNKLRKGNKVKITMNLIKILSFFPNLWQFFSENPAKREIGGKFHKDSGNLYQ